MKKEFNLTAIKALAIDMDGVLWRGDQALPGMRDFFEFLQRQNIPYTLVSNNSTKTPAQYQKKLAGMGVVINPNSLLTSSLATAAYLKRQYKQTSPVYIVGQDGLFEAVQKAGFTLVPDSSHPADIVVVGLDFFVTYDKLRHATLLIRRGASFVGTNGDKTLPSEEGFLPGAGAVLAAIEAATGITPTVIGKPERLMFDIAVERLGVAPEQVAMVGDRLETDILGGQRVGLKTILVTTGVDNEDTVMEKGIQPDIVFSGIDELTAAWEAQLGQPPRLSPQLS
jgi:4-nitrophenyl phosphatase